MVLNPQGEVLVVNQNGNSWSLPKGHIDKKEDAIVAAVREIYEESGVRDLEFVKALGKYERFKIGLDGKDDHSELKTIHMFLFRTKQAELKPIDKLVTEAKWTKRSEVSKLLTHPKDRDFFKKALKGI